MLSNMQDLITVVVRNTLPSKGSDGASTRASESDADEEEEHRASSGARAKLLPIDAVVETLKAALQEDIVARAAAAPVALDFDLFWPLMEEATAKSLSPRHKPSNSAQLVTMGELERAAFTLDCVHSRAEDNARVQIRMHCTKRHGASRARPRFRCLSRVSWLSTPWRHSQRNLHGRTKVRKVFREARQSSRNTSGVRGRHVRSPYQVAAPHLVAAPY
jgi:hypothetical protein